MENLIAGAVIMFIGVVLGWALKEGPKNNAR